MRKNSSNTTIENAFKIFALSFEGIFLLPSLPYMASSVVSLTCTLEAMLSKPEKLNHHRLY